MTSEDIKDELAGRALDVAMLLFPNGKAKAKEWCIGDIEGNEGKSLQINFGINSGQWKDFSSGLGGGNLIELWMQRYNVSFQEACREAAQWLGVTWDKKMPDGTLAEDKGEGQEAGPKKPAPAARPKQEPREARPAVEEQFPEWEEWKECVRRMKPETLEAVAEQRGLSPEFFSYLHSIGEIGVVKSEKHGNCIAFPVKDARGKVIACHYRFKITDPDSDKKYAWSYEPTGRGTRPMILGDPINAGQVWVCESQWDFYALLDSIGVHDMQGDWRQQIAGIVTRGAGNGRLVAKIAGEGKRLVLWPQNDEPNEKTGKTPSEDWVTTILENIGQAPCSRVQVPQEFEDANEWVKQKHPSQAEIFGLIYAAPPARVSKLPGLRDAAILIRPENMPALPQEIIKGILHRGSKITVGGPSKARKTFTLLDMAISVASGTEWWGFPTIKGRVCYLNFEVQEPFLFRRIADIVRTKKIVLPEGQLFAMTLRGMLNGIDDMAEALIQHLLSVQPFSLILVDPFYKLLGDKDENKAGDVAAILNHLERIAVKTGAAMAIATHFSKGNQASKNSMDRIGGSGAFARDADAIITMTEHEEPDAFTIETTLRNFAPLKPFAIKWHWPLFYKDEELDPADLKLQPGARESKADKERKEERKNDAAKTAQDKLIPFFADGKSWKFNDLMNSSKIPLSTLKKYIAGLAKDGLIVKIAGMWTSAGDKAESKMKAHADAIAETAEQVDE